MTKTLANPGVGANSAGDATSANGNVGDTSVSDVELDDDADLVGVPDEPDAPPVKPAAKAATPPAKAAAKPGAKPEGKADGKPEGKPAAKSLVAAAAAKTAAAGKGEQAAKVATTSAVPEHYELKGADGEPLDEASVKAVDAFARKLGLSNEAAQQYVDHEIERVSAQSAAWQEQIRNDPALGGDNLERSLEYAARGLQVFDADMQKLLDGALGDHPVVFRNLVNLGKRQSPDTQARSSADERPPARTDEDELRDMYPEDFASANR